MHPFALAAEGFRVATFHAELTRKGPGLLLRDLERGTDKQIKALVALTETLQPDILLLTKVDFDLEHRTAHALKTALGFEYAMTVAPNSMVATSLDLNGDGRDGDRQTWARYAGEGGMVLLSAYPVKVQYHLGDLLWKDIKDATLPIKTNGSPFPSQQARDVQKLVSQGLWIIKVMPAQLDPITLVAFQNQTPVFDGPEDFNGLRNRAQLALLTGVMDGTFGEFPDQRFVLMGNANLDPLKGEGDRTAIAKLLTDARIRDAKPSNETGGVATAIWEKPGPMRVSYVLPSVDWFIEASGVFWPNESPLREIAEQASRHRMVWMDITPLQQ